MSMPQPPACPGGQLYTIARGDTLFLLAKRFNTTVEALRVANPQITNPNVLVVGQKICLPPGALPAPAPPPGRLPAPPECPGGTIYTVKAGDTLFSIAQSHGLSVEHLLRANPQIANPNLILVGQQLCIPKR
ncbi:MAG TPA: LysM peptidoglycan-binding domain-containing protein [Firmicutes bacterium]|nr:LysM peptidoglycan-binding domain-containing protein [Bacillota bacterium]